VRKWVAFIFLLVSTTTIAQDSMPVAVWHGTRDTTINFTKRKWLIGGASVVGYGGSFIFLNEAWYKDYPRGPFHTFDDSEEWLQMDKIGHVWTAYHTSRFTSNMWRWAGVPKNKAVLLGTGSSLLYMFSIEYLDGRSVQWGWSWSDGGANLLGAFLFAGQEIGWGQQKVQIKFSSYKKDYGTTELETRADKLFGKGLPQRILKDYNAQTYWLSFNLKSFLPRSKLPEWLNIAVGYGAEGMYGGTENIAYDKNGNLVFDRRDIQRYRQWFLSPDIDLTKIKTKSKLLKSVFSVVNILKIPAPALEFSQGSFRLKPIAF
jgi:hypothetical protein